MLTQRLDPIVAVATAPGRGAVGIVRVSGKGLAPLIARVLGQELRPRLARFGPFLDADGQPIDQGLALFFPAPHSYTGEDVLELQAHGGPVVMQLLLARCLEAAAAVDAAGAPVLPRLRLAEPGEFTQRAFLNDKLDLAQAEAVADLIDASTEAAARGAVRSLGGAFSREVEALRQALIGLRMLVEATLDFPEEDIDFLEQAGARARLAQVVSQLGSVRDAARQGALLREGMQVVIAGQPNAGKSSLLNALAGAELAIVTPIAGTTRDKISQTIQIEGVPVHVVDTAGLRAETQDEVERIGIARSWEAIDKADAVLFLHDLTRCQDPGYNAADQQIAQRLPSSAKIVHVFNKQDLAEHSVAQALSQWPQASDCPHVVLSAHTGSGLQVLRQSLLQMAGWHAPTEGLIIARARHVEALSAAGDHLARAESLINQGQAPLELLAEELRLGHDALGVITGSYTPDDLLGEIFSRFCIGK